MARNLTYYTVFGLEPYYENLRISIDSLLDIGRFDGDIMVISDRPFPYRGVKNVVLEIPNSNESLKLRITAHQHFDFSGYNRIMYLDLDVLATRDVQALFARDEDLTYFTQVDTYYNTGFINCAYMDWKTYLRHWWRRSLNAGQFLMAGRCYIDKMLEWEGVCDRFADRRVFEANFSFKRVWRDQIAFNYLIRTGQWQGVQMAKTVRFPICPFAFNESQYTLWHYAAYPVEAAGKAMRHRYERLMAARPTEGG